jgi:hypothetical protein
MKTNTFPKITDYVKEEWKKHHMNDPTITVRSEIYGYIDKNTKKINKITPSLHLQIQQNGRDLVHLSIHLIIASLEPKHTGIIHFYKNEYKNKTKYHPRIVARNHYSLIKVHPFHHSLQFSINYGYHTKGVTNQNVTIETLIQEHMNIIVNVLNSIFDETNTRYIGHKNIAEIHPLINETVKAMNDKNTHSSRSDKHITMMIDIQTPMTISGTSKPRKTSIRRQTRKRSKNNQHDTHKSAWNMNVPGEILKNNNINYVPV